MKLKGKLSRLSLNSKGAHDPALLATRLQHWEYHILPRQPRKQLEKSAHIHHSVRAQKRERRERRYRRSSLPRPRLSQSKPKQPKKLEKVAHIRHSVRVKGQRKKSRRSTSWRVFRRHGRNLHGMSACFHAQLHGKFQVMLPHRMSAS